MQDNNSPWFWPLTLIGLALAIALTAWGVVRSVRDIIGV